MYLCFDFPDGVMRIGPLDPLRLHRACGGGIFLRHSGARGFLKSGITIDDLYALEGGIAATQWQWQHNARKNREAALKHWREFRAAENNDSYISLFLRTAVGLEAYARNRAFGSFGDSAPRVGYYLHEFMFISNWLRMPWARAHLAIALHKMGMAPPGAIFSASTALPITPAGRFWAYDL